MFGDIGEILYLIERVRHRSWAKTRKVIACGCCSYKPVTLSRKSLARQGDSWGPFCLGSTHSVVWCPSTILLQRYYQRFLPQQPNTLYSIVPKYYTTKILLIVCAPLWHTSHLHKHFSWSSFPLTPWVPPSWRDGTNSHKSNRLMFLVPFDLILGTHGWVLSS